MRRPGILVIVSDEHDANVAGCYGGVIVRTPALDGLAGRGGACDRCSCNSPLCLPSRLSFTAGNYVSWVGAWNNSCAPPVAAYPSRSCILGAAGYDAFLCGKQHDDRARRQQHGVTIQSRDPIPLPPLAPETRSV